MPGSAAIPEHDKALTTDTTPTRPVFFLARTPGPVYRRGRHPSCHTRQFGFALEGRLQALLADEYGGELPVGCAVVVETGSPEIPWCVSAPTMRVPEAVPDTANAQMRAAWDNVLGEGPPRRLSWHAVADLHQRLLA